MLSFCVSNRNCRPRCASFRATLEAKSLRPALTQGTDYTPVYLTRAAEILLWNLIKQFNYRLKRKLDNGDSWIMGIFGLLPGCPV